MIGWRGGVAVALVAAGIGGFVYLQRFSAIDVQIAKPDQNVEVRVFGVGTVEAQTVSRVGFQVQGRIIEVNADQGDLVEAGRVLARLDDASQAARLRKAEVAGLQAETTLAKATAQKERAEVAYAQRKSVNLRRQSLVDRGAVSKETAEDAQAAEEMGRADAAIAAAEVNVARAAREDASAQQRLERSILDQHVLRAPFQARIIARLKEVGSIANVGDPVFTLIDPASVWVRAYVDEGRSGAIRVGQTAWVRLRSEPDTLVQAEVVRIDQENDRVTEERRVYVRCRDCKPEHQIRFLGEQAEVEIVTDTLSSGLFVPARIVEGFDGKSGRIWTVESDRLVQRQVEFGARLLDGRLQVRSGLPEGAAVVTSDLRGAREGRAVRGVAGSAAK
ncbi:MAG: efflux RND transporter periplasmic adaptor subunit [Beijerinckiaceae bacterium]